MIASEIATLLNAKRIRRGQWMAKCVVHKEDTASLSIRDMGPRTAIHCFGCGAGGRDVMKALGLSAEELFVDAHSRTVTPEMRARLKDERRLEYWENQRKSYLASMMILQTPLDTSKGYIVSITPEYLSQRWGWRLITEKIRALREKLHPEEREIRERKAKVDRYVKKWGWTKLWEVWLGSEKGKEMAERYGVK